jgi:prepilin-type N-terminal cleavage/methylation domain-containing protein
MRSRFGFTRSGFKRSGFSMTEVVVCVSIIGLVFALGLPLCTDVLFQTTLSAACQEIATVFNIARGRAVFQGKDVGVRWISVGGDVVLSVYEDGNGNGVTTADIKSGVDRLVAGPYWMKGLYPGITFSFVPDFTGIDPNGDPVTNLKDPIKFGKSDICTFSPVGHASPGSVYLSNGVHRQAMVRVSPSNARIQTFTWHGKKKKWIRRW